MDLVTFPAHFPNTRPLATTLLLASQPCPAGIDGGWRDVWKELMFSVLSSRPCPPGTVAAAAFVPQQPWTLSPAVQESDLQVNTGGPMRTCTVRRQRASLWLTGVKREHLLVSSVLKAAFDCF